jgi:hypothetical protein
MVLENVQIKDVMEKQRIQDIYLILINKFHPIVYFSKYRVIPRTG